MTGLVIGVHGERNGRLLLRRLAGAERFNTIVR